MIPGDRRDPQQERRDVGAAVLVGLVLLILGTCAGMWMWVTYPAG